MVVEWATVWAGLNSVASAVAIVGAARVAYTSNTKSKRSEKGSKVVTELKSVTVVEEPEQLPGPDSAPRYKTVVRRIEREGKQVIDLSASVASESAAVAAAAEVLQKGEAGGLQGSPEPGLRAVGSDYNLGGTMRGFYGSSGPAMQYGVVSSSMGSKMNATTQSVAVFVNGVTKAPGVSDNVMTMAYNGGPAVSSSWRRPPDYDPEAGMSSAQYQRLSMQVNEIQSAYGQQLAMLNSRVEQLEKIAGVAHHHARRDSGESWFGEDGGHLPMMRAAASASVAAVHGASDDAATVAASTPRRAPSVRSVRTDDGMPDLEEESDDSGDDSAVEVLTTQPAAAAAAAVVDPRVTVSRVLQTRPKPVEEHATTRVPIVTSGSEDSDDGEQGATVGSGLPRSVPEMPDAAVAAPVGPPTAVDEVVVVIGTGGTPHPDDA